VHDLTGKTILLTGSSNGIGAATAGALGAAGAHLVAHYGSNDDGARQATAAIPDERKLLIKQDLSDRGGARRLWDAALEWRGRIDVLVTNAAILRDTPLDATDDEWDSAWDALLKVNVVAPATLMKAATNHFLASGGGTLITLASWSALQGSTNPHLTAYGATKAAVRSITQTLARAYARDGVLAYIVAPGVVRTRMSEASAATLGGEDVVTNSLAMREWVPPHELADLITYLATGSCRHLSGATIDVNGATYLR
jgi:NAD(P)-dependent dehydrogenase (short-subunit alcohol dehydrogenase family)